MAGKNKRSDKTERRLKELLLVELESKPIEKISVASLCRLADIDRTTFYLHYTDVYDLLGAIESDLAEAADQLSKDIMDEEHSNQYVLDTFLDFLKSNRAYIRILYRFGKVSLFRDKMDSRIKEMFLMKIRQRYDIPEDLTAAELNASLSFLTSGYYAIYRDWIANDCIEDITQILNHATRMTDACLDGIFLKVTRKDRHDQ